MNTFDTSKRIVISLGGSIIVPDAIDTNFIREFITLIQSYCERGFSFCIITGGGATARVYQNALREFSSSNTNADWIGIFATRFNAELLRLAFGDLAHNCIVFHPFSFDTISHPVIIGAGHTPGNSSDMGAVLAADYLESFRVVNLSNISYVYNSDPKTNPEAIPLKKLSWDNYLKIIPNEWTPGLSTPFDPVASQYCKEKSIEVAIINGHNLEALKNYLEGLEFEGTQLL